MVLIDSGSTHNFIHHVLVEETHCFVYHVSNFLIFIANGGMMKCGGNSKNIKLQMGDFHLKTHLFYISMGGCDIVLAVESLRTLGEMTMDYQDLYMRFTQESHFYTLRCLQAGSPEIISSHRMEKLLKKGQHRVISQLHAIQVTDEVTPIVPPIL
jgi:hypothetical protein